ncbi:hypothetical protein Q73_06375 [Bacillus coahuilensis m2-6]|uniref:DUF3221 domain-containing protein n=1 Tax=Bacillus coahuilensis p1.1.43 TaxID=1150625 RepID=A0A147K959_9BACI|nr:DUF3221 domain-containing protein [Bacillus coahuilensis]KUP06805.1 hypothetical protein Q75_06880 [Bacillus coahuilensis p1.1.43]KUP08362.1 hypothetical protein Q73_06375 [Bacillus coahuilensis m2-6]
MKAKILIVCIILLSFIIPVVSILIFQNVWDEPNRFYEEGFVGSINENSLTLIKNSSSKEVETKGLDQLLLEKEQSGDITIVTLREGETYSIATGNRIRVYYVDDEIQESYPPQGLLDKWKLISE